jgi:hypothetical protein
MTQPPKDDRREVSAKVEWITAAARALPDDGVCATQIRLTITAMDRLRDQADHPIISGPAWDDLVHQGGNQSLGDVLGDHGYHLEKYQKRGKPHYRRPEGGFTRALTEECFRVPPGYAWQPDRREEWAAAAAKATAERPAKAKSPKAKAITAKKERAAENPNDADLAARAREKREEVKDASQPYAPGVIPPLRMPPIPHRLTPVFPPDNTPEDLADDPPIEPLDRLLNSLMNDD